MARIIANKNLTTNKDIEIFLNPTRNDFHDPFLMPDMEKAVNRIIEAINKKRKLLFMVIMMWMESQVALC